MVPDSRDVATASIDSASDHRGLIIVSQIISEKIPGEAWHWCIHSGDKKIKTTRAKLFLQSLLSQKWPGQDSNPSASSNANAFSPAASFT